MTEHCCFLSPSQASAGGEANILWLYDISSGLSIGSDESYRPRSSPDAPQSALFYGQQGKAKSTRIPLPSRGRACSQLFSGPPFPPLPFASPLFGGVIALPLAERSVLVAWHRALPPCGAQSGPPAHQQEMLSVCREDRGLGRWCVASLYAAAVADGCPSLQERRLSPMHCAT
jgi:hypothetical protein